MLRTVWLLALLVLCLPLSHTTAADKGITVGLSDLAVLVHPREITYPADEAWRGRVTVAVRNLRAPGGGDVFVRRGMWATAPYVGWWGAVALRAEDSRGRPLRQKAYNVDEKRGVIYRRLPRTFSGKSYFTAEDFLPLAPRHCYGNEIVLAEHFPQLKEPGTYRVWFQYFNKEQPRDLPADRVFVGKTTERMCIVRVR